MRKTKARRHSGLALVEVVVATALLASSMVGMTQAMLVLNRNAAVTRVKTLAKALALSRTQEVISSPYNPSAKPTAIIPANLVVGTRTENVDLGEGSTGLGQLPATLRWTVALVGSSGIRSVLCQVEYNYLGRPQNYELITFRSPD